jgi:hypothetical protein
MSRSFTLFTGQWADLPLVEVCRLARVWGYDGLELACWGDHFDVSRALGEDGVDDDGTPMAPGGRRGWRPSVLSRIGTG